MGRYIVTGGCGFIGSQLTSRLIELGHAVIIIDNLSNGKIIHPKAEFICQDITDFDAIKDLFFDIDGCFHLAAIPMVGMDASKWQDTHRTNLDGSLNVFRAAIAAKNIPVVYASSCAVYGDMQGRSLQEDILTYPVSAYGCDKLSTELNAYSLAHEFQLPSIGLRFFNVYGPNQQENSPYSGVITRFITHILAGRPLPIFGDGEQTRDFVFVLDIVDNLIHAMNIVDNGARVFNICTGEATSINQLITLLANLSNRPYSTIHHPARLTDVKYSCGSREKMDRHGFKIKHGIEQALKQTIAYFEE